VSKSTISHWCKDIILTSEQLEKLRKNKGVSWTNGQRIGSETNRKKKIDMVLNSEIFGRKNIKKISNRDLLLIATALYWSEGSKSDTTSCWMFVNSDPQMILVMKKFLISVMKVPSDEIMCGVQINQIHQNRIRKVLSFWKNLLELDSSQMRKPYFIKTKINKVYENYNEYFGVCRLFVRKSKNLKYDILGLIKAMKKEILSA
jgi:hypothetical protein